MAQDADIPSPQEGAPVQEWIDQYLQVEGWTFFGSDSRVAAFGGPDGVRVLRDGTMRATVRHEYYAQVEMGGSRVRSIVQVRQVDCARRMYRVESMTIYERSNMQGASQTHVSSGGEWAEGSPNSLYRAALARICSAPEQGQRLQ